MASEPPADLFAPLRGHKYMSLTTFRRGAVPVATPVWFAEQDGKLYVTTSSTSGKVKRIRRDPIVTVAPCKANGTLLGPAMPRQGAHPAAGRRSRRRPGAEPQIPARKRGDRCPARDSAP